MYYEPGFRGELNAIGQPIVKELDGLAAVYNGLLDEQHNDDGSHSDITADTVEANSFLVRGDMANLGEWFSPGFKTTYFTGNNSMTWTVARADVQVFKYTIIGTTMIVAFTILGSTVAGTPSTALQISLAGNLVAKDGAFSFIRAVDNGSPAEATAVILAGESVISIYLNQGYPSGVWAASTDATDVYGQITFEVARV